MGLNQETGEVIIYFNFPQVYPKELNSLLLGLLKQTGWTWRINQETNLEALKLKLTELLPEAISLVKEPSIHREENKVRIKVTATGDPDQRQWQELKLQFNKITGWTLETQRETRVAAAGTPRTAGGKMEINVAFNHIKNALQAEGVEIYKTSLVESSIRVQFITPQAAEPYKQLLEKLAEETGYYLSIHPEPNASALFQKISSIIPVKKSPSLFKDRREIKIVVDGAIDAETKSKLARFFAETGYRVSE